MKRREMKKHGEKQRQRHLVYKCWGQIQLFWFYILFCKEGCFFLLLLSQLSIKKTTYNKQQINWPINLAKFKEYTVFRHHSQPIFFFPPSHQLTSSLKIGNYNSRSCQLVSLQPGCKSKETVLHSRKLLYLSLYSKVDRNKNVPIKWFTGLTSDNIR